MVDIDDVPTPRGPIVRQQVFVMTEDPPGPSYGVMEIPPMWNVTRLVLTLDANGKARVEAHAYMEIKG